MQVTQDYKVVTIAPLTVAQLHAITAGLLDRRDALALLVSRSPVGDAARHERYVARLAVVESALALVLVAS